MTVVPGQDHERIAACVAACQRGERSAFDELFEAHQDRVYSIALRYSGDRTAALDIAQDVFLKLWSSMGKFRGDASFESWLYRIVVNCCLDYRRRGWRLLASLDGLLDGLRPAAGHQTVLQELLDEEMQQGVQRAVAQLPPDLRMVVVLRYTEGLAYDAMAEILELAQGTVASRLSRAHKVLERRLAHLRVARGGEHA